MARIASTQFNIRIAENTGSAILNPITKKSDIKLIMAVYIPAPNFTPPIGITLYVSTIAATRY